MTMLSDDLKAARGLIDTLEKMMDIGSVWQACALACGESYEGRLRAASAFEAVLREQGHGTPATDGGSYFITTLARVDAAIAAAEHQEQGK